MMIYKYLLATGNTQIRRHNLCSLNYATMAKYEKITKENVQQFLKSFDTVLTDCDGVLWHGPDAIPGAPETFDKLKKLGKRIFPVTNNSTKTRAEYVTKCLGLGFHVEEEDIIGSSYVTAQYIKDDLKYKGKIYMIGSMGLYQELTAVGYQVEGMNESVNNYGMQDVANMDIKQMANLPLDPEVKCVVVGYDETFSYTKLMRATSYLATTEGCLFIVTNPDISMIVAGGHTMPGTGAIVAAVKTAAGREPTIICGKPHHPMYDVAHEKHNVNKETTIMIGDRLNTDIELAHNCGLRGVHVLTGVHTEADVHRLMASKSPDDQRQIPHYYVESFGVLGKLIGDVRKGGAS